ncbi:YheC/YheD family protein [Metabacillus sp. KIGAM252]|uniref:YheC/YheD family protein n=1 Tax=Metabacillus flavus TaxID=2823519 RepID=A0ABS5LCF6_9BACI|nr:YheC/YheD family protein [Metabacillus flavus]MBS2968208.1 YheC/YheD family protein [Metabacillus flavus]
MTSGQPRIAILTAPGKKSRTFYGSEFYFKKLIGEVSRLGGLCYVVTTEGIKEKYAEGFSFFAEKHQWQLIKAPLPDVIYNRIPSRIAELKAEDCLKKLKEKRVTIFNPSFFNKWEIWNTLSEIPLLRPFLPITSLIESEENLMEWTARLGQIYIKPVNQCQGKGIMKVTAMSGQNVMAESIDAPPYQSTIGEVWKQISDTPAIVQQSIDSDLLNGKKYDLRLLGIFDGTTHVLVGTGVRASKKQNLTTHVPAGGQMVPFRFVENRIDMEQLHFITENAGKALSDRYGLIGEFSIDAGVDQNGNLYIYEINSKPMKFDEPEIEEARISKLSRLFIQLAENKSF